MANNVLDYFKSFGGEYAALDDDALTQRIGETHPEFLDVPEFRQDFDAMPQRLALKAQMKWNQSAPEVTPFKVAMAEALKTGMPGISPAEAREYDAGDITPNYTVPHHESEIRKIYLPDDQFSTADMPENSYPMEGGNVARFADRKLPIGLSILAQKTDTDMAARKVDKLLTNSPYEGVAEGAGVAANYIGNVGGALAGMFAKGMAGAVDPMGGDPTGYVPTESEGGKVPIWEALKGNELPRERDLGISEIQSVGKVLLPMALAAPAGAAIEGAALTAGLPSALSYLAGASAFAAPMAAQAYHDTGGDLNATAESGLVALVLPAIDSIGRQLAAKGVSSVITGGRKLVLETFERHPGLVTAEIRKRYPGFLDDETMQKALEFSGGQLLANAFLLAHAAPEIAASEHPTEELLKHTAMNVALALATSRSHGSSLSKGEIRAAYAKQSEGGKFPFPVETVFHRDTSEKVITSDIPEMRARAEHATKLDDLENSLKAAQGQGEKAAAAASKLLPGTTTGSNEQPGSEMPVRAEAQAEPQEAPSPRANAVTSQSDQGLSESVPAEGETPVDAAVRLRRGQVTTSAAGRLGGLAERRGAQVAASPKDEAPDQFSPSSDLMARLKAARAGDEEQERQRLRQIAKGAPSLAEETDAPVVEQGPLISDKLGLDFPDGQYAAKEINARIARYERLLGLSDAAPKVERAMEAKLQGAELSPAQESELRKFEAERKSVNDDPAYRKRVVDELEVLRRELKSIPSKTYDKTPALSTVAALVGELDEDGKPKPYEDWKQNTHEVAQAMMAGATNEDGAASKSTRRFIIFHDPSNTDLPFVALPVYGSTSGAKKLGVSRKAQTMVPGAKASVGLANFLRENPEMEPVYAIRLNKGAEQVLPESKGRLTQEQMEALVTEAEARARQVGKSQETAAASADFEQSGGSVRDEAVRVRDSEAKQSVSKFGDEGDGSEDTGDLASRFFEKNRVTDLMAAWFLENDGDARDWLADNAPVARKLVNDFAKQIYDEHGVVLTARQTGLFARELYRHAEEVASDTEKYENTSRSGGAGKAGVPIIGGVLPASGEGHPRKPAAADAGGARVPGATQASPPAGSGGRGEASSGVSFSLERDNVRGKRMKELELEIAKTRDLIDQLDVPVSSNHLYNDLAVKVSSEDGATPTDDLVDDNALRIHEAISAATTPSSELGKSEYFGAKTYKIETDPLGMVRVTDSGGTAESNFVNFYDHLKIRYPDELAKLVSDLKKFDDSGAAVLAAKLGRLQGEYSDLYLESGGDARFSLGASGQPAFVPSNPVEPLAPGSSITESDVKAIQSLVELVGATGNERIAQNIQPSRATLSELGFPQELKDALETLWGARVIFVNQPEGPVFKAVHTSGNIFLSDHLKGGQIVLTAFGHELGHEIKSIAPELHKKLAKVFVAGLKSGEFQSMMGDVQRSADAAGVSGTDLDDEVVSDLLGEAFGDTSTFKKLAEKDPALFKKLADLVRDFLNRIINYFRQQGPSLRSRAKDYEKLQDQIVEILRDYSKKRTGSTLKERYASREPYTNEQRDPVTGAVAIPRGTQSGAVRGAAGAGKEGPAAAATVSRNREVQRRANEVVQRVLAAESRSSGGDWSKIVAQHGVHYAASEAVKRTLTGELSNIADPELRAAVEGFREFVPLWNAAKAKEFFEHPLSTLINDWDKRITDAETVENSGGTKFKGKPFADELHSLLQTSGAFKHLNDPNAQYDLKDITNWLYDLSKKGSDPVLGSIIAGTILQHPAYKRAFKARGERLGGGTEAEAFLVGDQVYKVVRLSLSLGDLSKKVGFDDPNDSLQFFDGGGVALPITQRASDSSNLPGVTPTQVVAMLSDGKFIVRQPLAGDPMNDLGAMHGRKIDMTPKGREQMFQKWADENGYKRVHVPTPFGGDVFEHMYFTRLPDGTVVALADVNERNVAVGPDGKLSVYDPIIHRVGTNEALKPMVSMFDAGGGTFYKAKLPSPDSLAPRKPATEAASKPANLKRAIGKQSFSFSLDRLDQIGPEAVSDATEIARMGSDKVEALKSGAAALDGMAYNRKQYRQAVSMLNRLWEKAKDEAIIRDIKPEKIAGPTDSKFLATLKALGVAHDPANTQAMQEAVQFERSAATHNRLAGRARTLGSLIEMLTEMGGYDAVITEHEQALVKVRAKLKKLGVHEHGGQSVADRSSEMWFAELAKPDAEAKRRALSIPEVHDNFVGPMAAFNALLEEFPDLAHSDWTTKLGMPENDGLTNRLFIAVNSVLQQFDHAKANLKNRRSVEEAAKRGPLNELLSGARDSSMAGSYAELVLADAGRAMAGEQGLTGDVVSAQHVQWVKENGSAVTRFATRLAEVVDAAPDPAIGTPSANAAHEAGKRILEWLREPVGDAPLLPMQGQSGAFGVSDPTLDTIFKLVASHDTFREAVAALVDDARGDIPMDRLAEIATAASAGKKKEAKALFKTLVKAKLSEQKRMTAQATSQMREAADIKADLDALGLGDNLFDSVAASPAFKQIRNLSENGLFGFLKPMVATEANVKTASESKVTLKAFALNDVLDQPAVSIETDRMESPTFAEKSITSIKEWQESAEHYVDGYDSALRDFTSGISGLTPTDLGYDTPTYRGLKLALLRDVPTLNDDSSTPGDDATTKAPSWVQSALNSVAFIGQIDQVATNLGGIIGAWSRAKVADYRNIRGDILNISGKDRFLGVEMPRLRSAALASHPELGGNMDLYRTRVQNPAGTIGRQFGSTLKVGLLLPSGVKVTTEDMAWYRRQLEYSRAILQRVQYRPDQATRVTTTAGDVLTRKAGSVGDFDFTRIVSQEGEDASTDLAKMADEPAIDTSTDLTASSTNKTVAFWNARAERNDALTWHVLDSQRDDLALKKDAVMRRTERALASDIEAGGYVQKFKSVGELVDALVAKFPAGTGLSPREHIIRELGQELKGYANMARVRKQLSAVEDTSILSQVESLNRESEFNKPAGLLELPSVFYDMGSLTNGDIQGLQMRAVAPAELEMAKGLVQALHELKVRLSVVEPGDRVGDKSALPHGWTVHQLKMVVSALEQLNTNLMKKPSKAYWPVRAMMAPIHLAVRGFLMAPKVGIRNITQGQMAHYQLQSMLNDFGRKGALIRTLQSITGIIGKHVTRVFASIPGLQQPVRWLKKHHPAAYKATLQWAESLYRKWIQNGIDEQRDLGFGNKSNVLEPILKAWRESAEFENHQDATAFSFVPRKVRVGIRRALRVPGGALTGVESKIGLAGGPDPELNAEVLGTFRRAESTLKEAAIKHGDRIAAGGAASKTVVPEDFSTRMVESDRLNHVADFREMLQMAGIPLEHALKDYYQRSAGGTNKDEPFFGGELGDEWARSLKRVMIGYVNAPTGTNRAEAIKTDRTLAAMFTLRGYIMDQTGKFTGLFRTAKGVNKPSAKLYQGFASAMMLALAAFLIGVTTHETTGRIDRHILRVVGKMIPSDKDFWTQQGFAKRAVTEMAMNLTMFGDVVMTILQVQQGGKGFDVASKALPITLAVETIRAFSGFFTMPKEDWDVIVKGLVDRFAGPVGDIRTALGFNPSKQNAGGVIGFKEVNTIANPQNVQKARGDFSWGPTTGMKMKLTEALFTAEKAKQGADPVAYANAMAEARSQHDRLVGYYKNERGMNDVAANAAARRDFSAMNPATRANGGKVMTPAEYQNASAMLSGDRKQAWDTTLAAWQLGASMFPDQSGDDVDTSPARERKVAGTSSGSSGSSGSSRGGSVNLRRGPGRGGVAASQYSNLSFAASSSGQSASAATPAASVRLRRGGGRSSRRLAGARSTSRNRARGARVSVRRGGGRRGRRRGRR